LKAMRQDRDAFTQLYDRNVDKIYKYLYYKLGNNSEAEDLTARVFLKAWEAIGQYRWTGRPFSAWLLRIAHNLSTDHFRARRDVVSFEVLPNACDNGNQDLDVLTDQCLTAEALRRALTHLTDDQQQVLVLRFLQGYNTDEIAHFMGKDTGAIRALQHRALSALRKDFNLQKEL
ncbi:MAG: sigma-70 family RNA polymerase sigma factor, partial [Chloroflexi bacterium]|nr:sigma-70 family RNA polymerase sigma factor [Chloroflexota bacterium]